MRLLNEQRIDEAASACQALINSNPGSIDALLLLGKARQMQGRFEEMLQLAEVALGKDPRNSGLQIQFIEAAQFCGHHDRALTQLANLELGTRNNAPLQQKAAQFYLGFGKYPDAHRCFLRAVELDRNNPQYLANLASSFIFMGDTKQAETLYSEVVKRTPKDYRAWYNLSTLRKQSASGNHIRKLEKLLKSLQPNDAGMPDVCFALAKEYEDLGKDKRSFHYLKRGADCVRRRMQYDVQMDVSLMQRITDLFDSKYFENTQPATPRRGPIFVLGLPRSGTTLVDRIISSHSQVESLGEINDLALTLNRVGQSLDRQQLLESSIRMDPDEFGQNYIDSVSRYGLSAPFFIDKTLTNYLYIGLIAKALPGAVIFHVHRHPVDSCLALYRALFREGNPFSYNLDDLAKYYIAYDRLMKHWHSMLPESVLEVSYEELVDEQEKVSKGLISKVGLDWEPACLEFHRNESPVATASAAQVNKPIYRDALARWHRFETQLEPLIAQLQEAGIRIT